MFAESIRYGLENGQEQVDRFTQGLQKDNLIRDEVRIPINLFDAGSSLMIKKHIEVDPEAQGVMEALKIYHSKSLHKLLTELARRMASEHLSKDYREKWHVGYIIDPKEASLIREDDYEYYGSTSICSNLSNN